MRMTIHLMDLGGFAEMSLRTWVPTGSRVIVYVVKMKLLSILVTQGKYRTQWCMMHDA